MKTTGGVVDARRMPIGTVYKGVQKAATGSHCLFTCDIEVFWILVDRTNSEHCWKIRYSSKDLPIFLRY